MDSKEEISWPILTRWMIQKSIRHNKIGWLTLGLW